MTEPTTTGVTAASQPALANAGTGRDGASDVVRATGIGKVFGTDEGALTALDGIDLTVRRGEFVSLIGPSGCGKSTLLRIVGDLTEPTSGDIRINDKPARQARLDRDYGMVFQAPVLMDWRTIAKNIELPLEIMGFDKADRARRSGELLALVELEGFAEKHPWQLSGGMQQRVAIARALAFDPKLLLMDEPFGALDEMTRERMNLELMKIWAETGITVLFVTHSIPEAVFLSTRVVVMSARPGRVSAVIDIDLPQPRTTDTRETTRYFELVTTVREALRRHEGTEEPDEPTAGQERSPGAGFAVGADPDDAKRIRAEGIG